MENPPKDKFLITRFGGIGDLVMLTPTLNPELRSANAK